MTAERILAELRTAGIILTRMGDILRASPKSRLNEHWRGCIRNHKPELLALLNKRHCVSSAQHECDTTRDETASPASRHSDPERSQIVRLSSAGAAGRRRKKAERCLEDDKTLLNSELILVHTGDGSNRLVELVRLLARRAARKYYEERKINADRN